MTEMGVEESKSLAGREVLTRGWSEKVFYGGLALFALAALIAEWREPNSPYFWMLWAALVPAMAVGFVRSWRIPLMAIDHRRIVFWRSPYTGPISIDLEAIKAAYVQTGRRKITIEFIRAGDDPVQFVPPFQSGGNQRRVIALLQQHLRGRVEIDPLRSR